MTSCILALYLYYYWASLYLLISLVLTVCALPNSAEICRILPKFRIEGLRPPKCPRAVFFFVLFLANLYALHLARDEFFVGLIIPGLRKQAVSLTSRIPTNISVCLVFFARCL
jgi:hypothetical protein